MTVTIRDGDATLKLNEEQLHVLADIYRAYTLPQYQRTGTEAIEVDLTRRNVTVRQGAVEFHKFFVNLD